MCHYACCLSLCPEGEMFVSGPVQLSAAHYGMPWITSVCSGPGLQVDIWKVCFCFWYFFWCCSCKTLCVGVAWVILRGRYVMS